MSNLNVHVAFIQNIINKGSRSDDANFSDRLIAHALLTARARLINIKLNKYDYVDEDNYNTICVPLEWWDIKNKCSCDTFIPSCTILRSKCKLPSAIVPKWDNLLKVMTIDSNEIGQMSSTSKNYSEYSIAGGSVTSWKLQDGHLVIQGNNKLKLVLAKNVWENPEDAANFCDCAEATCVGYQQTDFKIDAELVDPMYRMALELLGISEIYPKDNLSNARSVEAVRQEEPNEQI